jgi:hypothetical protein
MTHEDAAGPSPRDEAIRTLIAQWRVTLGRWRADDDEPLGGEWADVMEECADELESLVGAIERQDDPA